MGVANKNYGNELQKFTVVAAMLSGKFVLQFCQTVTFMSWNDRIGSYLSTIV